jgi:2-polyprenyl-3-methyl-5-hydroxy-6-metoxy-1,4-benzoquinol methylase
MNKKLSNIQPPEWNTKIFFEEKFKSTDINYDHWGTGLRASQSHRLDLSLHLIVDVIGYSRLNILDIGCGLGLFTEKMHSLNTSNNIHCCDVAEKAIFGIKKKYSQFICKVSALPNIEYPSKAFNLVTALEVIYYLNESDRKVAISQISRILKPNGYFLISGGINRGKEYFDVQNILFLISRYFKIENVTYNYGKITSIYEKYILGLIRLLQSIQNYSSEEDKIISESNILHAVLKNKLINLIIVKIAGIAIIPLLFIIKNRTIVKINNYFSYILFGEKRATHIIILAKKV